MSRLSIILGETGSGKSAALVDAPHESSFLINAVGKDLPFRKWSEKWNRENKNYMVTVEWDKIIQALTYINEHVPRIKNVFIDDFQYVMSFEYLRNTEGDVWDVFRGIGSHTFQILNTARSLRNDLNVFILSHSETIVTEGMQHTKMKTVGKMVDEKLSPEGLATIVLYAGVQINAEGNNDHYFLTQNNGINTAKTPMGMFETARIPNSMKFVIDAIDNYY